ncbi:unnamed protein product [Effrenium voratum]|uniref:Uncharacterized protein n=1 Tax=Effrenium voratum TaxID=2562239 RepID=A0AA36IT28_9DINO|nr:unnamed protein product [Effrenium voratum]CAJ1421449.1 unnamed protein product [Effrenium voratum]
MLAKLVLLCAVTGALAGLKWGSVNQTDSKENPEPDSSDLQGMESTTEPDGSDVASKKRLPSWLLSLSPPPPPPVGPYNPYPATPGADFIRYLNHDFKQGYVLHQEHDPSIQDPWKCWTVTKEKGFNAMSYSAVHRDCYFKNVPVPFPGATALDPWHDGFCQVKM